MKAKEYVTFGTLKHFVCYTLMFCVLWTLKWTFVKLGLDEGLET